MKLKEAIKALDDLLTTEAIADELVSLGITAEPGCISRCALAEYFMLMTELRHVAVSIRRSPSGDPAGEVIGGLASGHRLRTNGLVSAELPVKLATFAAEFDRGDYPKLIEGPPR